MCRKGFNMVFQEVPTRRNLQDPEWKYLIFELWNFRGVGAQPAWRAVWPRGRGYKARLVVLTPWHALLSLYSCWCRVYFDPIGQGVVPDDQKRSKTLKPIPSLRPGRYR